MPSTVGFNPTTTALAADVRDGGLGTRVNTAVANDPDSIMAGITRDQWQHFLDTYRPVEQEVLASAMSTDFSAQGDEAGQTAKQSVAAAAGTAERNLSRAGVSLTAEERSAVGRRSDLASTRATGQAENITRRTLSDTRTNLLANLVGIGRGVAQTSTAGLNSAANLAGQREQLHQQQKTSTQNSNMSMAASAAMLMISFA